MKNSTLLLIALVSISLFSCRNKVVNTDTAGLKKMLEHEHARYQVYFDSCIQTTTQKTLKDSSTLYIGGLFNNRVKEDNTYMHVMSYKRWDAFIKKKGKNGLMSLLDFHNNYELEEYSPTSGSYSPNFNMTISPFDWSKVEISMMGKDKINTAPIEHWAYRWMTPNDSMNYTKKIANIHTINFISATDTAQVNIDMGTAGIDAFYQLLDSIKAGGANQIHIKTYIHD